MRVVVITRGTTHAAEILQALKARNIPPLGILVEQPNETIATKLRRSVRSYGYVQTVYDIGAFLNRRVRSRPVPIPYAAYSANIHFVKSLNGSECVGMLKDLDPDLVVVAGAPILKREVLSTARLAALNAHPGLLPQYRGVDVIPWAVLRGDPVGVTVHQIDTGVDTGPIILQEQIPIQPNDRIGTLRRKAEVLAGELMARAVSEAVRTGRIEGRPQVGARKEIFRRMPRKLLRQAEQRLSQC
jgi:methionyl-tRNA formyltransferase